VLIRECIEVPLKLAGDVHQFRGGGSVDTLRAQDLEEGLILDLQILIQSEGVPEFFLQHVFLLFYQLEAVSDVSLSAEALARLVLKGLPGLIFRSLQGGF
jgi:hypothetical protein